MGNLPVSGLKLTDVLSYVNGKHGTSYNKLTEANTKFVVANAGSGYVAPINSLKDWGGYKTDYAIPIAGTHAFAEGEYWTKVLFLLGQSTVDSELTRDGYFVEITGNFKDGTTLKIVSIYGNPSAPIGLASTADLQRDRYQYQYRVRARDSAGQYSDYTNAVTFTPVLPQLYASRYCMVESTASGMSTATLRTLRWTNDGKKLVYIIDATSERFTMFAWYTSTPFVLGTITASNYDYRMALAFTNFTSSHIVWFTDAGTTCFVANTASDWIKRFVTSSWNLSMVIIGTSKAGNFNLSDDIVDFKFSADGHRIYILDTYSIREFYLSTAFDWTADSTFTASRTVYPSNFGIGFLQFRGFDITDSGGALVVFLYSDDSSGTLVGSAKMATPYILTLTNIEVDDSDYKDGGTYSWVVDDSNQRVARPLNSTKDLHSYECHTSGSIKKVKYI